MKPLEEIKSFPIPLRELLEQKFGIRSAEAFFEHATRNGEGIRKVLKLTTEQLDPLLRQVEGHLAPAFVNRCRQPVTKHGRGVIVD